MATYRPRATVEAIQWIGGNIHEIWDAFTCADIYGPTPEKNPDWLIVTTAHGEVRADIGDWIVRGTTGPLMVCREADFGPTYEPTEPTNMTTVSGVCTCSRCEIGQRRIYRMVGSCANCQTGPILMFFRAGDPVVPLGCPRCGCKTVHAKRHATDDEIPGNDATTPPAADGQTSDQSDH